MAFFSLGLSCASANLREEKIDTERSVLVIQIVLELGNLFPEHVWGISDLFLRMRTRSKSVCFEDSYTTNNTQASGIGDRGGQLGSSSHVHACEQDWVLDLEEVGDGCLELLRGRHFWVDLEADLK